MKKVTVAAAIAAILGVQTAGALELVLVGEETPQEQEVGVITGIKVDRGVDGTKEVALTMEDGTVVSFTSAAAPVVTLGTGISTCGDRPATQTRTQTCPDGTIGSYQQTNAFVATSAPTCWEPGPTWLPATPPDGACVTSQPPPGCVSDAQIECAFDIPANKWTGSVLQETLTIPKGKVLVSAITTNGDSTKAGNLSYETPTGAVSPNTNVWISATPNGAPLQPTRCHRDNVSFLYSVAYTQVSGNEKYRCLLALNKTYYVNMKHVYPDTPESRVIRFRK